MDAEAACGVEDEACLSELLLVAFDIDFFLLSAGDCGFRGTKPKTKTQFQRRSKFLKKCKFKWIAFLCFYSIQTEHSLKHTCQKINTLRFFCLFFHQSKQQQRKEEHSQNLFFV